MELPEANLTAVLDRVLALLPRHDAVSSCNTGSVCAGGAQCARCVVVMGAGSACDHCPPASTHQLCHGLRRVRAMDFGTDARVWCKSYHVCIMMVVQDEEADHRVWR